MLHFVLRILFICCMLPLSAQVPPRPEPAHYVNDFAQLLPPEAHQALEQKFVQHFKENATQIVFALFDSLPQNIDLETFSNDIFNQWGIGGKENKGVLLLLAIQNRAIRIEVGYGLEAVLPDSRCAQIIDEAIIPHIKARDYTKGLNLAADLLMEASKATVNILPKQNSLYGHAAGLGLLMSGLLLALLYRNDDLKNVDAKNTLVAIFGLFVFFGIGSLLGLFLGYCYTQYSDNYFLVQCGLAFGITLLAINRLGQFSLMALGLLLPSLLILGLFIWSNSAQQMPHLSPMLLFWGFHIWLLGIYAVLFVQQQILHHFLSYQLLQYNARRQGKWKQLAETYTQQSIQSFQQQNFNNFRWGLFFQPSLANKALADLRQVLSDSGDSAFLKKRMDADFIQWAQQLKTTSLFKNTHQSHLESKLQAALQWLAPYVETGNLPPALQKEYDQYKAYFKERLSAPFAKLYQTVLEQLNLTIWTKKASDYQDSNGFLAAFQQIVEKFDAIDSLDSSIALQKKQTAILAALAALDNMPKRNDLEATALFQKLQSAGTFQSPIYQAQDRAQWQERIAQEMAYFKANAARPLLKEEKERLSKLIQQLKNLIGAPDKLLLYDQAFLEKNLEAAKNIYWQSYLPKYSAALVEKTRNLFAAQIAEIPEKQSKRLPELANFYLHYYKKLIDSPDTFLLDASSTTYSGDGLNQTSHQTLENTYSDYSDNNSSYSDYSDSSSYSDYSDTSFGSGESGGGGASGSW